MSELHTINKRLELQDDVVEELQGVVGQLEDAVARLSDKLEATECAYTALLRVWKEVHAADIPEGLGEEIGRILLEVGLVR